MSVTNRCKCGRPADPYDAAVLASGLNHPACQFPRLQRGLTASAGAGAGIERLVVALADARRTLRRLERASR